MSFSEAQMGYSDISRLPRNHAENNNNNQNKNQQTNLKKQKQKQKPGLVVNACHLTAGEGETGRALGLTWQALWTSEKAYPKEGRKHEG